MEHVLVRYSELGTKSRPVRERMRRLLANRIRERLQYDGIGHERVAVVEGRVLVETGDAMAAAGAIAELPGVASTSAARRTPVDLDAILEASDALTVGETFGVRANRAVDADFTSRDVNETVGARVESRTGASVDLDDPATWLEVDVRDQGAFLFTDRVAGPGGFPVGADAGLAALISGGIDSPVAAHEAMTRGCDVVPVYVYNRPFAAEDHLARFEEALRTLVRFHPGKAWYYYLVDFEAVNDRLAAVGRGRMLLHRAAMFRVAERIAADEGLDGLVTGEALGQKSSQTPRNLAVTSAAVTLPVHRPLLTWSKEAITAAARDLGTFESAVVDSACRTIAPEQPATAMDRDAFDSLAAEVDLDGLVEAAAERVERVEC